MTKLITQLITLLFCLSLNAQSTPIKSTHPFNSTTTNGKENLSVINVGILNSIYHDYCPIIYNEGILFTSDRIEDGSMKSADANFYFSKIGEDRKPQTPVVLDSELNSDFQEGMAVISPDGKTIVFSREVKQMKQANGFSDVRLYTASLENGQWVNIKKMAINMKDYSSGHPALSDDGSELYFVSNRPGGYGGTDVYVSKMENGRWSKPKNLGAKVNSPKNELFPSIDQYGTLYFSVNKRTGLGLLDIYKIQKNEKGEWGHVVNMGEPFNSKDNDFGFYMGADTMSGYFSSSREGGLGGNDIYYWGPTEMKNVVDEQEHSSCVPLVGNLIDKNGSPVIQENVRVEVFNLSATIESETFTSTNGTFEFCLACNSDFSIKVFPKDYYFDEIFVSTKNIDCDAEEKMNVNFDLLRVSDEELVGTSPNMNNVDSIPAKEAIIRRNKKNKEMLERISIAEEMEEDDFIADVVVSDEPAVRSESSSLENKKAEYNEPTVLPTIYYDFDSYQINEKDKKYLNDLSVYLKNNPNLNLAIKSYTDAIGKRAYNKWLSKRRAEMVMTYLVQTGVEELRLKAVGKGEEIEPTEEMKDDLVLDDSKRRRTEFEILNTPVSYETTSSESGKLNSTKINEAYILNIYYGFDVYELNSESTVEVEKLIRYLNENPDLKVEIRSHTDSRGSKIYNQKLSQKRAEEVVRYVASRGIDKSRLSAAGYGESELANNCTDGVVCSRDKHLENRRTEFIFSE